jgi:O-succinylbenzoic acid--CoA ligase
MKCGSLSVFSAAAEAPEGAAVIDPQGTLSWGDLASEAGRAIAWLRAFGPLPERLALPATGDRATLALFHACIALGIPVAPIDPRLSTRERHALLDALGVVQVTAPEPNRWRHLPPEGPAPVPPMQDDGRPLAFVFTSGTTGRPRAVVLSRAAFVASTRATADRIALGPEDRWLLAIPFSHIGGLSILTRSLVLRSAVVLAPLAPFRAAEAIEVIARYGVTRISLVPTQLDRLLAHAPTWDPPESVRTILIGGAAASMRTQMAARVRGWPVLTTYGLTEACSQVALEGQPLAGVEVRIIEDRIAVRGPTLLTRYLDRGETTTAAPLDGEGWFLTSDLGRMDDAGLLECLGRADDLIVTGGEKVSPDEVEQAALAHPGVMAACAVGISSAEWGAEVALAVVAEESLEDSALKAFLETKLAKWKQPRRLLRVPALPERGIGKVDRRAITALFAGESKSSRPS